MSEQVNELRCVYCFKIVEREKLDRGFQSTWIQNNTANFMSILIKSALKIDFLLQCFPSVIRRITFTT